MSNKHSIPLGLVQSMLEPLNRRGFDLSSVISPALLSSEDLDLFANTSEKAAESAGASSGASSAESAAKRSEVTDDERLDLDRLGPILRSLWKALDDESTGFLKQPLRTGTFSMMCHALISAGNLRRAFLRSGRYMRLMTTELAFNVEEQGDEAYLFIHYDNEEQYEATFFITSLFVIWIRLACWLIKKPILLERIYFTFPEPSYAEEFKTMFPCRAYFGQPENCVIFDRSALSAVIEQDPGSLSGFLRNAPECLLTQYRTDQSDTAMLKRILLEKMETQTAIEQLTFEEIAQDLSQSPHTLRRRLREEGQSFQSIKDSVRRDQALYLLKQTDMSQAQLAERLGFSESAAFSRAFKKWTGSTPGQYRERWR